MTSFDVIVAGVGAMGSQACWHLARRGQRVLGLDRHDIPNAMGSSHGVNRIIRLAYFEHPAYVPLLQRAYQLWRELECASAEQILTTTGSLDIGAENSSVLNGSLESCRRHGLEHAYLDAREVMRRYPAFHLPDNFGAVWQPQGGFVASERAVAVAAALALDHGATLRARESVLAFDPLPGGGVTVRTPKGTYEAQRLILAAGSWIGELVPRLSPIAVAERQVLAWFQPKRPEFFRLGALPVSNLKFDDRHIYQFPVWQVPGFKIGLYHHLREQGRPEEVRQEPDDRDEAVLRTAVQRFFPEADGELLAMRTCLFTNTPDGHFILDALPECHDVIVASPCSGHGFKFAPVIGEILADMAMGISPKLDIKLFELGRFGARC